MTTLTRTRRTCWAAVATALVVGLSACTAGGDEPDPTPSAASGAGGGGGPVVIGTETLEPLVEVTLDVPRSDENKVTVGVVSLVASGPTAELRVLLTPDFASEEDGISIYDMFGKDVLPRLWDVGGMREYQVVSDTGIDFETDVVYAKTSNGEPILYQAFFPTPVDRPETVDVVLHPSWPVVEDVPVTYED